MGSMVKSHHSVFVQLMDTLQLIIVSISIFYYHKSPPYAKVQFLLVAIAICSAESFAKFFEPIINV